MLNITQSQPFFHRRYQKQSVHKYTETSFQHILTMLLPYLVNLDTFKMTEIP